MSDINIDSTYGVIIIQNLKAVYVDENYAKIYGYQSADELLNNIDSFLELIPIEFHSIAKQNYFDLIAGKMLPHGHTFKNVDRYGKEFTVFSIDHVIEWLGSPALQVTVMDLSIVVEAHKKVREKDLMFKRLIMNSAQGIMIHREFKPILFNQAWAKEMRAESMQQAQAVNSLLQFIPQEQRNLAKERYKHTLLGKVVNKSTIVENICFDGSKRFFNIYDNLIEWEGEPAVQVILEDVTEKVALEKALAYRASHDQLSDLLNRSAVYDWLDDNFKSNAELICILIDIDDFKEVNDSFGHQVGDDVIKSLSGIIKESVLQYDGIVGRWGGEEFIAFVPNISGSQAEILAESIRTSFNQIQYPIDSESFNSSVSVGISCDCDKFVTVDALIKSADKCLYLAKVNGKNCVVSCKGNEYQTD